MSLKTKIFEFDRFVLDLSDKTLYRDGQVVNLSLKAFDILRVLFENRPHVVEKRALMEAVWPDSFVEEGNLTFTISQLRRLLDDSKHHPRIIETVHRRGYRFVADARIRPYLEEGAETDIRGQWKVRWLPWVATSAVIFLVLWVVGVMVAGRSGGAPHFRTRPMVMEKLSNSGQVVHAVISRDGRYVVYTNGTGVNQQSVWLRQRDSGSNVEIIEPSDHQYLGLALSPDGNTIYFARRTRESLLTIYRLSIFGGLPLKIAEETEGWMSISPDGKLISFVRCHEPPGETCSLYVADAIDGSNAKRVVSYDSVRIADNEFSPDGRSIAFAFGQTDDGEDNFRLAEIDVDSSELRHLSPHKFYNIKAIVWLPDDRGWLITANRKTEPDTPIIHLPSDGSSPVKLTQDSQAYAGLSATADLSAIVATQADRDTSLYLIDTVSNRELNLGGPTSTVTISADNQVYFSSGESGNVEIWTVDIDGSKRRQLTNDPGIDFVPLTSTDGKTIFFSSSRSGEPQIWRMNVDGGDQTQVTRVNGGWPIFLTRDGKWLYYRQWSSGTLWRVSTDGSGEVEALARRALRFQISPDGSTVLLAVPKDGAAAFELVELETGNLLKSIAISDPAVKVKEYSWTGDGNSIVYVAELPDGTQEIRSQPVAGGASQKLKKLDRVDLVHHFSAAPDGGRFAIIQGGWKHDAALLKPVVE